jgi:hypothetical protein
MNIFNTILDTAIKTKVLPENNFVVQQHGEIKQLGFLSKVVWEKFAHIDWVRKTLFNVDNEALAKYLKDVTSPTISQENVNYLRNKGNLTSLQKEEIQRKINTIAGKIKAPSI